MKMKFRNNCYLFILFVQGQAKGSHFREALELQVADHCSRGHSITVFMTNSVFCVSNSE